MTDEKDLTTKDAPTINVTVKYLDTLRQAIGLHINPETAEVWWTFAYTVDPYGDFPNLPEEYQQIGREYFARSPGSHVWIWFGDLPKATSNALVKRWEDSWPSDDVPF